MHNITLGMQAPADVVRHDQNSHLLKLKRFQFNTVDDDDILPDSYYGYMSITGHHIPKDTTVGFVFGPGKTQCDVWLPSEPDCNSRRYFAIKFDENTGAATMKNLSKMNIIVRVKLEKQEGEESLWETIMMTFNQKNIKLKRDLHNANFDSPKTTSFLDGKLIEMDSGLKTMGPDSTTVVSTHPGRSRNDSLYRLPAASGLEAAELPDVPEPQYSNDMIFFKPWKPKPIAHAPCKGTVNFSTIIRELESRPNPMDNAPLKYMLPNKHTQKQSRQGTMGIYIPYANAATVCERRYRDKTEDLVAWLREEASKSMN